MIALRVKATCLCGIKMQLDAELSDSEVYFARVDVVGYAWGNVIGEVVRRTLQHVEAAHSGQDISFTVESRQINR